MDVKEFYQKAGGITKDPMDRLSAHTQKIVAKGNYVVDCHCHLFPRTTLSLKYILKRFDYFISLITKDKTSGEQMTEEELKKKLCLILKWPPYRKYLTPEDQELINEFGNCNYKVKYPDDYDPENKILMMSTENIEELGLEEYESGFEVLSDEIQLEMDAMLQIIIDEQLYEEKGNEDVETKAKKRLLRTLKSLLIILETKSMEDVYKYYSKKFLLGNTWGIKGKKYDTLVVAPLMDLETGWQLEGDLAVKYPYNEVIQGYLNLIDTEPILPFLAVDPARDNLYESFLQAFLDPKANDPNKASFFGLKVYPALGYTPADYRLMPIYKVCAEKNIPVMTHCGSNMINAMRDEIIVYPYDHKRSEPKKGIFVPGEPKDIPGDYEEKADQLNHPRMWEPVLIAYKDLKLNLAHFGGSQSWEDYDPQNEVPTGRIETVKEFMQKFPNVYADFSFNLIKGDKVTDSFFQQMEALEIVRKRSLYGTDFWVVTPMGDLQKKQQEFIRKFKKYFEIMAIENPNKFLGLDPDSFPDVEA